MHGIDIGCLSYIGNNPYIEVDSMPEPPFIVGRPAVGDYFIDREKEIRKLLTLIRGVQEGAFSNSVLIGLRRTGKTSILYQVTALLEEDPRIIPIIVNCYGMTSKGRLAKMLVDSAIENYVSKTGDKAYLQGLRSIISKAFVAAGDRLSEVQFASFSLKLKDVDTDEITLLEDAFRYVETLAKEKDVCYVIMLDEFQDIIRWGEATLKRFRVILQSQNRVCYVFAGSATTIMRNLVYDTRSPFYRQLVEIPITKLEDKVVRTFIRQRFAMVDIKVSGRAVDRIVDLSQGYPDYLQRLGLELFLASGPGGSIAEEDVDRVYEYMLIGLDGEFDAYFGSFSPLEREILAALSIGKIRPSEVAREVRKPLANISKTLTYLLNCGIIERPMTGQYRVSDPVLCDWLNRRFRSFT